jgi:hypothetical protein
MLHTRFDPTRFRELDDVTDADAQPLSLAGWRERQVRELAEHRERMHAQVDRWFDVIAERQKLDAEGMERHLRGDVPH